MSFLLAYRPEDVADGKLKMYPGTDNVLDPSSFGSEGSESSSPPVIMDLELDDIEPSSKVILQGSNIPTNIKDAFKNNLKVETVGGKNVLSGNIFSSVIKAIDKNSRNIYMLYLDNYNNNNGSFFYKLVNLMFNGSQMFVIFASANVEVDLTTKEITKVDYEYSMNMK